MPKECSRHGRDVKLIQNLNGRDQLGDLSVDRRVVLRRILRKARVRMLIGFMWLSIGSSDGPLRTR